MNRLWKIGGVGVVLGFLGIVSLSYGQDEHKVSGKLSGEEVVQKTQNLRMPFIANEGQLDEEVRFYARTFGGTVFVTNHGEIVYSLPKVEEKGDTDDLPHAKCRVVDTDDYSSGAHHELALQ